MPKTIYATKANPFPHAFSWGDITTRDNSLYLFVRKDNQAIDLNGFNGKITDVSVLAIGEMQTSTKPEKQFDTNFSSGKSGKNIPVTVLKVSFEDRFTVLPKDIVSTGLLTAKMRTGIRSFQRGLLLRLQKSDGLWLAFP